MLDTRHLACLPFPTFQHFFSQNLMMINPSLHLSIYKLPLIPHFSSSKLPKMATRTMKLSLFIFLLFAIVSASLVLSREDPELLQCQHQCRRQRGFDHEDRQLCEERCEDYIRVKKQRERSEQEEEYDDEREEPYEYEDENPYLYQEEHFDTRIKTEEGRVEILEKFTERSNLLRGIENYRVGFLRANPGAFVSPVHFDADIVFFVAYGRPTVSLVREEKTENHNLEPGHILRVPAGIPVYMINRDEREELFIVKLIQPVANPGSYQAFYGPGGEDPESFYTAFSWEVLEHAFKMDRGKLERLFRQQKQGSIMRATKEQVRELSQKGRSIIPLPWPFPGDAKPGSFDLLSKRPSQANQFGQLYEADARDYMQLQDLDLMVSFANITRGAMSAPYYNSKATKIAFVVYGEGHFEMACPHLSSSERQRRQRSSPHYERVVGRLRRGTVFVAPAGHPVTIIASQNSNLQVVCFEVNARANTRFPLTGKNNIVNRMERVAKELSFNVSAREVDRIFGNQQLEFFFPGPNQTEGRGRAYE